jgi:hypothetical protein
VRSWIPTTASTSSSVAGRTLAVAMSHAYRVRRGARSQGTHR